MDQIQKSLCDMKKQKPECLTDRKILRATLADYLPNDKLKQNVLLNAFDNDIVQNLGKGTDVTLNALNCITELENDYGITKDAAFWSIQTWCYLLGLNVVADALSALQPTNQPSGQTSNSSVSAAKECKIGVGVYRAGTDFPAGEISVQLLTKKPKYSIWYGVGKNPMRIDTPHQFKDKFYVYLTEGQYLKIKSVENYEFIAKGVD